MLPVPASYWQPLLPEGLTAVTIDPAGEVGLEVHPAFICDTPGGGFVGELWIFVVVEPLAAWKHPDTTSSHLFPAVFVTTNDTSEAQYRDWGFGNILQRGTVDVSLAQAPVGWMGSAHAVGATSGVEWEEHAIATGTPAAAPGATVRVFAWEDGKVTGAIDVTYPDHMAIFDAEAIFTIRGTDPPLPPPAWPATAELHFPEGHDFTLRYVELPELE